MDLLTPLISNLSAEERNEFRLYLKRVSKSAVEPKLFDVLVSGKELTSREIAAKFYNPINMNAYHGLRKGILQQLYSYIVMKRGNAEAQSDGGIFGMISMGQFMLEKNAYQLAEYYLLKAEKAAI
jgi:radical SAM superfamily enzyme